MVEKKTTLFELHMHGDAQFGPSIIGGGGAAEESETVESESEMETSETSGSRIPRVVMAVVAIALISFAARKARQMMGQKADLGESIEVENEDLEATA